MFILPDFPACVVGSTRPTVARRGIGNRRREPLPTSAVRLRKVTSICEAPSEALARTKTSIAIRQQILTYQAEALNLLKQKSAAAGAHAQEISGALDSLIDQLEHIAI